MSTPTDHVFGARSLRHAAAITGGVAVAALVALPAHAAPGTATTTTVELKSATVAYGEETAVTVSVDGSNPGAKPAGIVTLKVGEQELKADLAPSGKATFDSPLVDASTTPYGVTATFTPTDATAFDASTSAPVNLTVTKDTTESEASAKLKARQRKLVAKTIVTSANGEVPDGKVTFVARRNGIKLDRIDTELNKYGKAKVKFLDVKRTGTYKVVAKYRGSDNFVKSKGTLTLTAD